MISVGDCVEIVEPYSFNQGDDVVVTELSGKLATLCIGTGTNSVSAACPRDFLRRVDSKSAHELFAGVPADFETVGANDADNSKDSVDSSEPGKNSDSNSATSENKSSYSS